MSRHLALPLLLILLSFGFFLLAAPPAVAQGYHRLNQVLTRGNGVNANVAPYASINVCVAFSNCATAVNVCSDPGLTRQLSQPVQADANGNYSHYVGSACVDERISAPNLGTLTVTNVCISGGASGSYLPLAGGTLTGPLNTVSQTLTGNDASCVFGTAYGNNCIYENITFTQEQTTSG